MDVDNVKSKRVVIIMSDYDYYRIKKEAYKKKKRIRDIVITALHYFYDTSYWNEFDKYKYKSNSDKRKKTEKLLLTGNRPSISFPIEEYYRLEEEQKKTGYSKSVIIRNALYYYFNHVKGG